MAQSLAKNILHLTFSTKLRRPLISPDIREELARYLVGVVKGLECPALEVNCVADHAHILFCLSKNIALAEAVEKSKKASSKWIKTASPAFKDFYWQAGYGAFSVSQSSVSAVRRYIVNQQENHRKMTFQEELIALLKKHQIEYDQRYLWD